MDLNYQLIELSIQKSIKKKLNIIIILSDNNKYKTHLRDSLDKNLKF